MTAQSITQKRKTALEILKNSSWDNSKAKRTGSKTEQQWQEWRSAEIAKLEK